MPWFPTFLKQLQSGAVSWIPPLSLRSFFELPTYFFAHTIFPESIWNGLIILTWGLFALAMILLWKLKGMGKPLIILISLFFFSLLAVILASIQKPLLIPRYFVSLTPVVALIAAYITIWTVSEKKIAFLFVPILLLLGAGYSVFALTYFDRTPDWRSAANYIQEMAEPEDKIVLFSGQMGGASLPLIYYLGDSWLVMANSGTLEDESAVELVLADLVPTNRVWLIQSTRRTPSRSLNYQPNLAYGPYVLLRREVFDDRAIKPHLSIDLWLLEVAQP
ncbi:MAG: hypothetical protein DHS20C20_05940 [Ardenticatenaceae bacterium]|nr:MAG: hypothetical protein DHS20C20_05940 [Ardenticatenaceae bacterium]